MSNMTNSFQPYHPGELLKEELKCRQIKQKEFAHKYGISYTTLNEVLNAKRPVSTNFALLIEAALGISADLLMRIQISYNIQTARQDKRLLNRFNKASVL
jgi:antitoxin HigA-1